MIGVEEAKRIVMVQACITSPAIVELNASTGFRLAKDVIAPHDHPLFDMSAVDGYAFAFDAGATTWRVVTQMAAGDTFGEALRPGECVRIFTGAMLPAGADTVVMQEFVRRDGDTVTHSDSRLCLGGNVRQKGEQVKAGDVLLQAGTCIGPAAVGLLASVGVKEVTVHERPLVNLLRTGGEFVDGMDLAPGRIFSSNDAMLESALRQEGVVLEEEARTAKDDADELREALRMAAYGDVLITTGGVSVGDHDLVRECLERLGATIHFHGVAQKPGKPMLFATLEDVAVFALPGNPRAVLVLYYEYVLPFLRAMQGAGDPFLREEELPIAAPLQVKGDRAEFRAALVRNGRVELLADEGSHMLRTLQVANALAYLSVDRRSWAIGDPVTVHYLPQQGT